MLSGMLASVPVGMDMQLPALPEIAAYFSAPTQALGVSVPLFFLGNTLGQFFGGPLSDHLGRKTVGAFGLALSLVSCIAIVFAPSAGTIALLRTFQGIGAGAAAVIAMPTLRDAYTDAQIGTKIASAMLGVMLAQLCAPFLGALLLYVAWQAVFITMSLLITLVFWLYLQKCPETIAKKRIPSFNSFYTGYARVFAARHHDHRLALRYVLVMAATMAVNLSFVTSSVFIYRDYFGVTPFQYSLLFASSVLCMALCAGHSRRQMNLQRSSFDCLGMGLRAQLLMVLLLTLCCAANTPSVLVVAPVLILASGFTGLVIPHCMTLYLRLQRSNAGSAISGSTASNFLLSGLVGLLLTRFQDDTLLPTAIAMLALSISATLLYLSIPGKIASDTN